MRAVTVGLDVGTTNTKAVVLDVVEDTVLAMASTATPAREGTEGPVRDAGEVVRAASEVLHGALSACRDVDVVGVCTASVGEEVVLVGADGAPRAEVPVWYGPQGSIEAARRGVEDPGHELAGVDRTFSLFKLAWYDRWHPEALARAAAWTDLSGFVAASLIGRGAAGAVVDTSHASRTGLLDLEGRCWDLRPLEALEIHCPVPPMWESGTVIDVTNAAVGSLPAGTPVVAGGHDHFCGAYGAGLEAGGTAYISAGTSEAQLVVSTEVPNTAEGVEVGCYVADRLYYAHLPMPAGRVYQRWRDLLWGADVPDADVLASIEEATSSPLTVVFERRTGAVDLRGVPLDVTREELLRGLMVGIAGESDAVTDLLAQSTGRAVSRVLIAGAPASSPAWRRLRRSASTREVTFVTQPEATAVGAARLAARAVA